MLNLSLNSIALVYIMCRMIMIVVKTSNLLRVSHKIFIIRINVNFLINNMFKFKIFDGGLGSNKI